jgi:hypothetical protein
MCFLALFFFKKICSPNQGIYAASLHLACILNYFDFVNHAEWRSLI